MVQNAMTGEMSSTTESSDWNLSPNSRPINNLDIKPLSPPPVTTEGPATANNGKDELPSAGGGSGITSYIITDVATAQPPDPAHHISTQQPALVPTTTHTSIDLSIIDQQTPEWEAARESVLKNMVTSEVAGSTPTQKVSRGSCKTGGRRGRGGRRPKITIEPASGESVPTQATNAPTRAKSVNRGGRPRGSRAGFSSGRSINRGGRPRGSRAGLLAATIRRGVKRKRKNALGDTEEEADDTDASEEINLPMLSSSGRRITQANTFTSATTDLDAPTKKSNTMPASQPPSAMKKPKMKRIPGATAVCKNCGRGHSPSSNQIVFCDGCDTPWHQYCHDRPITPSVIQIEEKEWYCAICEVLRNERIHLAGRIPAAEVRETPDAQLGLAEKRKYFQSLEKDVLVSLLLHATSLHEDLAVFEPTTPNAASATVSMLEDAVVAGASLVADDDDEISEEPLPYPKMGNGLVLPPEEDDLDIMIDENIATWSHSWKEAGVWKGPMAGQGLENFEALGGVVMGIMSGGVAVSVGA
ncbi:MAG: hypothetical protein Q9163_002485 [Psora crenata]